MPRPNTTASRSLAGLLATLLLLSGLSVLVPARAEAAVTSPFTQVFSANTAGDVVLRGNGLLTCPTTATSCEAARAGTGSGAALNNNSYAMVRVDTDSDPTTVVSSTADVQVPSSATVLFAGLYWGANTTSGSAGSAAAPSPGARGTVKFRVPGSTSYSTVTASRLNDLSASAGPYQGFAEVTTAVRAAGSGTYGVADVQTGTGADRYAGWGLVVAYSDPNEPVRNLTVFTGFGSVSSGETVSIPISGFQTPPSGTVRTRVGAIAYEGDLGSTGDQLLLASRNITDAVNPSSNVFNSTTSALGVLRSDRNPSHQNLFGVDIDRFTADSYLPNGATTSSLTLTSTSETYYPGALTVATELYAPTVAPVKSATDLNGGNVEPGDVLEYRIAASNTGQDAATEVVVTDPLPAGVTYVPGSLTVGGAPRTDAVDGDTAEVVTSGGTTNAVIRLGTGASSAAGGRVPVGGSTAAVVLRVRVDSSAADGATVANTATATYTGEQTGLRFRASSAPATSTVTSPRSDLRVTKTGTPLVVQRGAGTQVTYSVQVVNDGPRPEAAAVLTDQLPAGVPVGAVTPSTGTCNVSGAAAQGQLVTCQLGALAVGATASVTITAVPSATAPATATDTATVSGTSVDPTPGNNTATASTAVNTAPTAGADTATTGTGQPVVVPVLANDTDGDGDALTTVATVGVPPVRGSTAVGSDGTVTYTPGPGFAGTDAFEYTVSDGRGGTATGRVTVTVDNAPPVAVPDSAATAAATPVTVAVLTNDTDPNIPATSQVLSVTSATTPASSGTATVLPDGQVRFTPAAAFRGTATVTYVVSDGAGGTATGTLSVVVSDAAPVALDDSASTAYRTPVTVPVLANDSDPNGDSLTITDFPAAPAGASVALSADGRSLVVTPTAGTSGATVSFPYTITAGGLTATATVRVAVGNAPVTAVDDADSTATRDPLATTGYSPLLIDLTANDTNPDDDTLTVVGLTDPARGVVTVTGTNASYVPEAGFRGTDTFTYTVSDGKGSQSTATVTVTVRNAAPVVLDDQRSVPSQGEITVPVLDDDRDPNGDPLTLVGVPAVSEAGGTVTVVGDQLRYTAPTGFRGDDVIRYQVSDGQLSTPAVLRVSVVNSPPVARDDRITVGTTAPVSIPVLGGDTPDTDLDGDPLTVVSVTQPARGSASISADGRSVVYDPAADLTGADELTYRISDGQGGTSTARVTVTVTNRPPAAVDDAVSTTRGTAVTVRPADDDTDPDGDQVTVSTVEPSVAGGTTSLDSDGTVRYTPPAGFTGTDSFGYLLTDGRGGTARGTVTVTVPDAPPVAADDTATTDTDTPVVVAVLGGDSDPDGDPLEVVSAGQPAHGVTAVRPDGTVTYSPDPGYAGPDQFSYVVGDGRDGTATGTVTVVVRNALPVAHDDTAGTAPGVAVRVDVVANDGDANLGATEQRLSIAAVEPPAATVGTVSLAADDDRVLVFTPAVGFQGTAFVGYVLTDGAGGTSRAVVAVLVDGARPAAVSDAATTDPATPVAVHVVDNDTDPNAEDRPGLRVQPGSTAGVTGGTAVLQADGRTVLFTPDPETVGEVSFTYRVVDPTGRVSEPATVTITVRNAAPVAREDTATTSRDTELRLPASDLLADDTDANGDVLRVLSVVTGQSGGTVVVDDRGTPDPADDVVVYTPPPGFTGTDQLTYTISDGRGGVDTARLLVTVPNASPNAPDITATVPTGQQLELRPTDGATDPEGDPLTVLAVTQPSRGGVLVVTDDQLLRFTPSPGFAGQVSFTYTLTDGRGGTATATATVTVQNAAPVAVDDTAGTAPGVPVTIDVLSDDTDPNIPGTDQQLGVASAGPASDGGDVSVLADGRLRYTPAQGTQGTVEIGYVIDDGAGGRSTGLVRVLVDGSRPAAVGDVATLATDATVELDVVANDTDPNPGDVQGLQAQLTTGAVAEDGSSAGEVGLEADGRTLRFVPRAGFAGLATVTYQVVDPGGLASEPAVVRLTVRNAVPIARDDELTTARDTELVLAPGQLRANDTDANGDQLRVIGVSAGTTGSSVSLDDGGTPDPGDDRVRYTPAPGFTGVDVFAYTIDDGRGGQSSAQVRVTVPDLAPTAADDTATLETDGSVLVDVLAGDGDPDGDPLTVVGVSTPSRGSAVVVDGLVRYTPAAGYAGPDSFRYTVSDGRGGVSTATVLVEVRNAAPVAADDTAGTAPGVPVVIPVLDGDTDANLGATDQVLSVASVVQPARGSVTTAADGRSIVFTPAAGQQGSVSFTYVVTDGQATDTAVVTVLVDGSRPQAGADTADTDTDVPVAIDVLTDDTDPNGDVLVIDPSSLSTPVDAATGEVAGSVTVVDGQLLLTPADGFAGTVVLTYRAQDDTGLSSLDTRVTVVVRNAVPIAADDQVTTTRDTELVLEQAALTGNDTDANGDPLTVVGLSGGAPGSSLSLDVDGRIVYVPAPGFTGTDTFSYVVTDGRGGRATADVQVQVPNGGPTAVADEATAAPDAPVDVDVVRNDTDPDGDPLRVTGAGGAQHGTVVVLDGRSVRYTPAPGWAGPDTVTYTVTDGRGPEVTGTLAVTTENAPPVAEDDAGGTAPGVRVELDVLADDTDPNVAARVPGQALTVQSVTPPAVGGTVEILPGGLGIAYTPPAGFQGTATFSYVLTDGAGGSSRALVTVVVDGSAPAAFDDVATTDTDVEVTLDVLGNDTDPNPEDVAALTTSVVTGPTHGTAELTSGGLLTYTPGPGYAGQDTVVYEVRDPSGRTSRATVRITVRNAAPTARLDRVTAQRNTPLVLAPGSLLANDTDPNGDALLIVGAGGGAPGSTVLLDDRNTADRTDDTVVYTPPPGFTGTDTFTYDVSDGRGGSSSTTVTVLVPDAAPVADADETAVDTDGEVVVAVLEGDTDPDGDPLTVTTVGQGAHGRTVLLADGTVRYTPDPGYAGPDEFGYEISDGRGGTAVATVTVLVRNAAPVARADTTGTAPGVTLVVRVLANDVDANTAAGQQLAVVEVGPPAPGSGTTALDPQDRTVVLFTPAAGFQGVASFAYTVSDGVGGTATSTVQVLVDGSRPLGVGDTGGGPAGAPLSVDVLANDVDPNGDAVTVQPGSLSALTAADGTVVGTVGTVVIAADGTITVTPADGFRGTATFTYRIVDSTGLVSADTAVVVQVGNRRPVAGRDEASVATGGQAVVDVLGNDRDPDGDPLTVESVVSSVPGASVTVDADGRLVYRPAAGQTGEDVVTYVVSDGRGGTTTGQLVVTVTAAPAPESPQVPQASPSDGGSTTGVPPGSGGGGGRPSPEPLRRDGLATTGSPVSDVALLGLLLVVVGAALVAPRHRRS